MLLLASNHPKAAFAMECVAQVSSACLKMAATGTLAWLGIPVPALGTGAPDPAQP